MLGTALRWHARRMARSVITWSKGSSIDFSAGKVHIAGLTAPRRTLVNIQIRLDDEPAADGRAVVEFNDESGRFELREIEFRSEPGHSLTGEILRAIPLASLLDHARPSDWEQRQLPPGVVRHGPYGLLTEEAQARMKEAGPVTETLRMVATIYQVAYAMGDPPTKQVAAAFDVPRPTAERWVRRARERGFLGESEHGRAATGLAQGTPFDELVPKGGADAS